MLKPTDAVPAEILEVGIDEEEPRMSTVTIRVATPHAREIAQLLFERVSVSFAHLPATATASEETTKR